MPWWKRSLKPVCWTRNAGSYVSSHVGLRADAEGGTRITVAANTKAGMPSNGYGVALHKERADPIPAVGRWLHDDGVGMSRVDSWTRGLCVPWSLARPAVRKPGQGQANAPFLSHLGMVVS